ALLAAILAAVAAPAQASAAGCPKLSGSFRVVPGSPGAGQISYTLRVKNGGSVPCTVRGLPALVLLGIRGQDLPTHVSLSPRFTAPARPFVIRPGKTASATARFSPDVPGKGEGSTKGCEPIAHTARVAAGGARFVIPIKPVTRVCEHGSLVFTPYR
ncbi:MAG TPA: DUF4232 domain-containing protein, partial [Gaiellaceae bacterium]|nr:DUF4232 domain-containing protein [Gaiellaceae bacterium]